MGGSTVQDVIGFHVDPNSYSIITYYLILDNLIDASVPQFPRV